MDELFDDYFGFDGDGHLSCLALTFGSSWDFGEEDQPQADEYQELKED